MRCIPCEEAEFRNKKIQQADIDGRAFMRENNIPQVAIVEVLRDGDGFKAGDYTYCELSDPRLYTIFYQINTLIL